MRFALNNIRSAWNVGAIMRTCDALGARIILVGYTAKPRGRALPMIAKTAIGAESTVAWESFDAPGQVLETYGSARHVGVELARHSQDAYAYFSSPEFRRASGEVILWLGNEISGLESSLLARFEATVHLPMLGTKESLNVASTACAVGYLCHYHLDPTPSTSHHP